MQFNALFWLMLVIYGCTALLTLGLVIWRAKSSVSGPHDDLIAWIIKTLIAGILVETAVAVIGLFVYLSRQPPTPPVVVLASVRANVSQPMDAPPAGGASPAAKNFLVVPQRTSAELVAATTEAWTVDPAEGIATFISHYPFQYDFSELYSRYEELSFDKKAFEEEARDQWMLMVQAGEADADRTRLGAAAFEAVAVRWFRSDIVGKLEQIKATPTKKDLVITSAAKGLPGFRQAARAGWKRILRADINKSSRSSAQALLFHHGIDGRLGSQASPGHICPSAPAGALVYRGADAQTSSGWSPWQRIRIGDVIQNPSDQSLLVQFAINDDIFGDNGSGYADLLFKSEPGPQE